MIFLLKKKILKKLKEFKESYSQVRFYKENEPVIYIHLNHKTKVRTYLNLFFRIRSCYKEPIVIKFSVLRMIFLAKWFKNLDYIYFEAPFSNNKKAKVFSHKQNADFIVNYNYKQIYSVNDFQENALPYIMHPGNYMQAEVNKLPKKAGILMSGNFEEKIYNTKTIQSNFGLLNRWEIYQEVIKYNEIISVSGTDFVNELDSNRFNGKFVLMKWQSGAIPTDKWRHYLSAADFIFCAPGMTMPMCHNVLEAMSVGVIPILNYAHWLNPSLQNDYNCLVYEKVGDIKIVIDKALSMSGETKNKMMKNVLDYYSQYYQNFDFEKSGSKDLILLNENTNDLK